MPQNCVLDVTAELIIDAGTVIEFGENAGIGIYDDGKLLLNGAEGQPVVFKGTSSLKGWWRGIHIETQGNAFSHVSIEDAGSNYVYCCHSIAGLFLKDGKLTISDTTVSKSGGCGIFRRSKVVLTQSGVSYAGNVEGDFCEQ